MPIRYRMIFTYLVVLLVPSLLIGTISYESASKRIETDLLTSASVAVHSADSIITSAIQKKMDALDYYSNQISGNDVNAELVSDHQAVKNSLQQFQAVNKDVINFYVGTSKGNMVLSTDVELPADFDPRKRDWYILALKSPNAVVSPSYLSVDGNIVVSISKVLKDGSGVIAIDLNLDEVAAMADMKVGTEGYIVIVDSAKNLLVHPTGEIGAQHQADYVSKMFQEDQGLINFTEDGKNYKMSFYKNPETGWRIGGMMSEHEVSAATEDIRHTVILVVVLSILGASVIITMNIWSILSPLRKLNKATSLIGNGDLTQRLDGFRTDEIGQLAGSFQLMVDNLRGMVDGVREMTDSVSASAEELTAGTEQTTKAIEHVTVSIQDVAVGSEQQLHSVEQGTSSVMEMVQKVEQISEDMQGISGVMSGAAASANQGAVAVGSTEEKINSVHQTVEGLASVIHSLSLHAENIGEIIGVIAGFSKQTHMLALNASIEAARAGEQGRGFAVVAQEVRKLAEGSQQSSNEIQLLIHQIQEEMKQAVASMDEVKDKVTEGMEAVEESGGSFGLIRESVIEAAGMMQTASVTMNEIAEEAAKAAQAMEQIRGLSQEAASNTETISAAAEEQLASLQEMASSANDLSSMSEQLQQLVGQFKTY